MPSRLRQELHDHAGEFLGDALGRARHLRTVILGDLYNAASGNRILTRQATIERHTERVEIRSDVGGPSVEDLRRCVVDGALSRPSARLSILKKPEVDQLCLLYTSPSPRD